jgi:hypothetical protein
MGSKNGSAKTVLPYALTLDDLTGRYTSEHAFLSDGSAWSVRPGGNIGVL